jgi:phenylacetate-coenzyme A ligase PaaK-like adenylate-forming protein
MTAARTTVDPLDPHALAVQARVLLERDSWSSERLAEFQRERLRALLRHAVERSPYYRERLGADAAEAELSDLPTLPKQRLMDELDRVVTDSRLRRERMEPFLDAASAGELHLGEYRIFSTSGTSGVPGLFVYSRAEFAHWVAVFLRTFVRLGLTSETRLVGVAAPSALHLSQQVVLALQAGRGGAPRVSVTTPLGEMVEVLDGYRPHALGGYPSILALLAEEQLAGRLDIDPEIVLSTSEVLTDDAATRIERAWTRPVQGYFSTEVGVIAADSPDRVGMHVCEEAIVEVVDDAGRPVPRGQLGSKVLLTNLVSRTQPLIRYELLDAVQLAVGDDPSGRPYDRIERIDGRSDEVLELPAQGGGTVSVHPYRLRAPFVRLLDVVQYQIVGRDEELFVRVVPAASAPRSMLEDVRVAVEDALAGAGARLPVRVEAVDAIVREPGHAAKVKLVLSERAPAGRST